MDLWLYPLIAGILVTATHVPMGQVVLKRGIVFLDLAVAQIAGLGVMISLGLHLESQWLVQGMAVSLAVLGAAFLYWCERRWPDVQEAIIGSVFIVTASAALLAVEHLPNAGDKIKGLLSGQIALVELSVLGVAAAVYAIVLAMWFGMKINSRLGFYLLFAVTVTVSVQLVGVYLVFATLILPALAVRTLKAGQLVAGYTIGIIAYVIGVVLSWQFNLTTGPVIVVTLALTSVIWMFVAAALKR